MENAETVKDFYETFKSWTRQENLTWQTIGLDIEPDIREFEAWVEGDDKRWAVRRMLRRVFQRRKLAFAQRVYREWVGNIHADGYQGRKLPSAVDC